MPARGLAVRLFLTCWLVYALHFTTNIVREIYPAVALGDHFSFRVDEYAGLHPDLFEKEDYGWHIGNNPGASMLGAIPYALARPVTDRIVQRVRAAREDRREAEPPQYETPSENDRRFFAEAWRRGIDVKLGLAAFAMQAGVMAPISALSAVVMFFLLRGLLSSQRMAVWLALLYAFGTPVFYRTGFLNHNLLLGISAFMGFLVLWDPGGRLRLSDRTAYGAAGLAGGTALLFDYSGIVFLVGLFAYGIAKSRLDGTAAATLRRGMWYVLGSIGPILLLNWYQWRAFGNPFLPGQHWMPPVEWIELGYRGYGLPQPELLWSLAFDHRFGLFASCPLLLLAFLNPLIDARERRLLPVRETVFILLLFAGLWLFFSGSNYARLQFNTGVRYMTPIIPFLFVPAAVAVARMPRLIGCGIGVLSVTQAWCMAMYRDMEQPLGVLDPVVRTFVEGFQLPALNTISRTLPLFLLAGVIIFGMWMRRPPRESVKR
jgi:hypothetical protein